MTDRNSRDFADAKVKAKLVSHVKALIRRYRLDCAQFDLLCRQVRKEMGLRRPARSRHLPKLLPKTSLRAFYDAVDQGDNLQHQIMLRLLFYTAARVSELTAIRVEDVDLDAGKIFIASGKGDRDRYIVFPDSFRLILKAHLAAHPDYRYLFESRQHRAYSTRRVQQIVQEYAELAAIEGHTHPHIFRHQMLTWLTAQGMPDAAIQLISGHTSKKSLEVYQHLSLADVQPAYQKAVKRLEV